MKMFQTGILVPHSQPIKAIEVARANEKSVWLTEDDRRHRESTHAQYFDAWDAAKCHLIWRAGQELDFAKKDVDRARSRLEFLKALKHPSVSDPAESTEQ